MANDKKFDVIPDASGVDDMERRLRFHYVENGSPATLSREQIEHYNREGFLSNLRVFDQQGAGEIREYFDALLERVLASGGDAYSISTAHLSYGRVWDLLTHPKIVTLVADLLGPNVVAWGSHFFCKLAGDPKSVAWHQDASYWPLSDSKTATVWLAIDDADVENACMRFLPGSHRHGHIEWRASAPEEQNVLDQTIENAERFGAPYENELRAGELSIHSDLLVHGSNANLSNRRRCGLTLRYCSADVRAGMDWNRKGVVVRGRDETGHWGNPARPEKD